MLWFSLIIFLLLDSVISSADIIFFNIFFVAWEICGFLFSASSLNKESFLSRLFFLVLGFVDLSSIETNDFFSIIALDFSSESSKLLEEFILFNGALEVSKSTFLISFSSENQN